MIEPPRLPPWTPADVEEVRRTHTPEAFNDWLKRYEAQVDCCSIGGHSLDCPLLPPNGSKGTE